MKSIAVLTLILAIASTAATAAVNPAEADGTSGDSMSGMMHAPAAGMMGMTMNAASVRDDREQPLLSLALKNSADLALSAEQETTLRKLVDRFGKDPSQRLRDIQSAERDLAGLLNQGPADLPQADNKVRTIEKLRADLRVQRIRTIAEGRAVLTPEQRVKLDQLAVSEGHPGRGGAARGEEDMQRFMSSERMPQAMNAMMAMAERMGDGDTMLGMVRMMDMMSMMGGGTMGMNGGGMMGNNGRGTMSNNGRGMMESPPKTQPRSADNK